MPIIDRTTAEPQITVDTPGPTSEITVQRPKIHVVQKGDTLYSIALSNRVSQKDLAEWNNIHYPGAIHVGQQLYLSPPAELTQPSLFSLPQPASPSKAIATPGTLALSEAKPLSNTEKLKNQPKAFKLPYSEQAVAQLKGLADTPVAVLPAVAKADAMIEKNAEISVKPSTAEAVRNDDGVEWIWPTKGKVLEGFSESTKGIDISGKPGQAVTASAAGKVVYSGAGLRGYGKLIIIKHNNTYLSAYAHNNKILVKEGQAVAKGQKIAEMGNTDTDLVKLHFEIRKNGKPVDPLKHLPEVSG
ncbi:peptidoglycan DD-metalloendopeptidase family protein [Nitrosovibrio tenuis]|uniref:peptidoglycan DD-metalloendopeptidase family protein n=1 Tax=Nitrosovibrio tenuis TaxID=1233 RepID=UPI001FE02F31|nr:peptidoglycan DD-metalloendopeptidase family protein [Nitrosovibrio tenuis]